MNIEESIQDLKSKLEAYNKKRLLCISTTANVNNPKIAFGSLRETKHTIAGNILIRDLDHIDLIINEFDGFVDYFAIDCENKSEVKDLDKIILPKIEKSKYFIYKPNDFTVDALDMFIACRAGSIVDKNILIVGCGNIGAKAALKLCERGANVKVNSLDSQELKKIVLGLNLIKKQKPDIEVVIDKHQGAKKADIVLGCTPGITAIDLKIIELMNPDGFIIDVGNGTLDKQAIETANIKNIDLYCLSAVPGYSATIKNWHMTESSLKKMKKIKYNNSVSLITPGFIGKDGDILVDDVYNPTKIIGVCNGLGDVYYGDEAKKCIDDFLNSVDDKIIADKIRKIR